jgi:two-component system NtrC family sensor kinase
MAAFFESGASTLLIDYTQEGAEALILIQDDGGGIPDDRLEKIFDPFFTTRLGEGGSGLDLSVAQGIVKSHGGRIEVESSPETGTRFAIYLPLPETSPGELS